MDEMKFPHHRCDACKPLAHSDGFDLYHCDQPGHHTPTPVLVAVYELEGKRKERLCQSATEAKDDTLFNHALEMANERGWYLKDQPQHTDTEDQ